jgi:hypothetical protein
MTIDAQPRPRRECASCDGANPMWSAKPQTMSINARDTEPSTDPMPVGESSGTVTMSLRSITRLWRRVQHRIAWLSTTRANARAGLVADVIASCALLYAGSRRGDVDSAAALATGLAGLVLFSFVEYCFHRWLFPWFGGTARDRVTASTTSSRRRTTPPFLPPLVRWRWWAS